MKRISATTLESYRLFRTGDWMEYDHLKADLEGGEETPLMRRGTSLHDILENPGLRQVQGKDGSVEHVSNGIRWSGLAQYLDALPFGVPEVKAVLELDTNRHGKVAIVAKADMLQGLVVREFKTCKQFNPEKYLASVQWRVYSLAFRAPVCIYTVFQVQGGEQWPEPGQETHCQVRSAHKLACYAYDGIADEVASLADDFIDFCDETGLRPRGMREVSSLKEGGIDAVMSRSEVSRVLPPDRAFRWRDRHGAMHSPRNMETRHLFYTLRMIWNHRMPEAARIEPFRAYTFGPHYTDDYFKAAIQALGAELACRSDMAPEWRDDLVRMIDWLGRHQISEAA